jgi:hypothetical protein
VFFAIHKILKDSSTRFLASEFFVNQPHMKILLGKNQESGRDMKKLEVKNLVLLSLYGKFLVSRETASSKNIFG